MIKLNNFKEIQKYFDVPDEAIEFLNSASQSTENKKYFFSDDCYINVMNADTKAEASLMEAHERFVDVQCLISGEEKIYFISKEGLAIQQPYSEAGDAALYDFAPESESVTYTSGEAVVLYPEDAHLPNRAAGEPRRIKKAVMKVAVTRSK